MRGGGSIAPVLATVAVLLMTGTTVLFETPGTPRQGPFSPFATPAGTPRAVPGASLGPPVARTPSTFWSLDLQTNNSTGVWTDPTVRSFLNQTPFTWFRYGEWTEECNISSNQMYGDNGSVVGPCSYNLTALRAWCASVGSRCHLVLPLPAENDDPAEDAYIASWIVHGLGIQPALWSIGNEPMLWKHYGLPWTHWTPSDHRRPTPRQYALQLAATMRAVRAVDPPAKFMGLESACACDPGWLDQVGAVDGGHVAAIGYHSYPSTHVPNETLQQFMDPLRSAQNISSTYSLVRSTFGAACSRCPQVPIYLHEYNSGPGNGASSFGGTYPNAVYLAASVAQALLANVTQFTIFNLQSDGPTFGYSMINSTDAVGPTGLLFSEVLNRLVRGTVYLPALNASGPVPWDVLTENAGHASLLVVNANLTANVLFATTGLFRSGSNATVTTWDPSKSGPTTTSLHLAGVTTVPPLGILLIEVDRHSVLSPVPGGLPSSSSGVGQAGGPWAWGSDAEIAARWM